MPAIVKTKNWSGTLLGRRASTVTNHFDTNPVGLREVITTYIDEADPRNGGWPAGTVTRRVIKGDGRYAAGPTPWKFQEIEPEAVVK